MDAGDRFELPMHLAYETGVVTTLPAVYLMLCVPRR